MAEPITLTLAAGIVLAEGVKFLYGQAGELLTRWRKRQDEAAEAARAATEAIPVVLPADVFEGELVNPVIHYDALAAAHARLRELRRELVPYVEEGEPVDAADTALLERVDLLRGLLEAVYQQRITFKGEQRPASGPLVDARVEVEEVLGRAAALKAGGIKSGAVRAEAKAKTVGPGGELYGVDADTIGG